MQTSERPPARLVLADGRVFEGVGVGADVHATGEVVFTTSMTGYQEALTDPSFRGQILTMTFPLQGNYGLNQFGDESAEVQVRGFVVREMTDLPSHWQSVSTLHEYLAARGISGIAEVDTRALTRHLRSRGVVMGTITRDEAPEAALARLRAEPDYASINYVPQV
ncbi:MAG: carbamoyl phosphate synthase small subunit, partial [Chloroflexi bacterium]|nr:carbamoyl phosphate synthase small subunit [Chloroflexota bacterium]